jgi:hypothetical protein
MMPAVGQAQDGDTALMSAARQNHTEVARMLLECGANKDVVDNVRITAAYISMHSLGALIHYSIFFVYLRSVNMVIHL